MKRGSEGSDLPCRRCQVTTTWGGGGGAPPPQPTSAGVGLDLGAGRVAREQDKEDRGGGSRLRQQRFGTEGISSDIPVGRVGNRKHSSAHGCATGSRTLHQATRHGTRRHCQAHLAPSVASHRAARAAGRRSGLRARSTRMRWKGVRLAHWPVGAWGCELRVRKLEACKAEDCAANRCTQLPSPGMGVASGASLSAQRCQSSQLFSTSCKLGADGRGTRSSTGRGH